MRTFVACVAAALIGTFLLAPVLVAKAHSVALRAHAAIIGGQSAAPGTFPWLAWIIDRYGRWEEGCTGTVVAPNLVLTAAHCVENETTGVERHPEGFQVITGDVDWQSPERQVSRVAEVIVYPSFVPNYNDSRDAALLVLSTPTSAPAIALGSSPAAETRTRIAGWGQTTFGGEAPTKLQWAETTVQSSGACEQVWSGFDPNAQLCTVDSSGANTCHGDSGGPLIVESSPAPPVDVGVNNQVANHCSPELGTLYTAAASIEPWVKASTAALSPLTQSPASPPPPTEVPGRYATLGSATHDVTFRVTEDGQHVVNLTAEAMISCQHGTSVYYGILFAIPAGREAPASISEATVRETLKTRRTSFYRPGTVGVYLHFIRPGLVEGRLRLRVRVRSKRYGLCYAPSVSFFARQVGG